MTKQEIENKFLLRFGRLSNWAKVVLELFKLSQFESFYSFFIEQNKRIIMKMRKSKKTLQLKLFYFFKKMRSDIFLTAIIIDCFG